MEIKAKKVTLPRGRHWRGTENESSISESCHKIFRKPLFKKIRLVLPATSTLHSLTISPTRLHALTLMFSTPDFGIATSMCAASNVIPVPSNTMDTGHCTGKFHYGNISYCNTIAPQVHFNRYSTNFPSFD